MNIQSTTPRPKLLKSSSLGEFKKAEWNGKNESGYTPVGIHVMVLPDTASDLTSGGISLTPESVDRQSLAAETGVIVAMGPDAFLWNADRTRKWEGWKPKPGDRVYMTRYAGQLLFGEDQNIYRVMNYECIMAIAETSSVVPLNKFSDSKDAA